MARALLIVNPVAARTTARTPERVARVLTRAGWQVDLAMTTAPGEARELARQAVVAGVDTVVVCGGDGTTMQAAGSLVGTEVALGLIPRGTGNLLAGNLRIPSDPVRAARVLIRGRRRRIDLGRVELADGVHYFGVACGAGVDAWVMGETAAREKRRWGMGAYMATTVRVLPRLRNTPCTVTVDGQILETEAVLVLIMNCGELMPPLVRIRPEINPEDGVLDLVTVAADSPWQGLRGVFRVILDGYRERIRETPYIRYARGTRFTVDAADPLPVQFDGDPAGMTPFTAEVVPHALTVLTN
ncbi:MAG TPA: diacylglycerol kinase family protein [Gemmatimonadales bacterium]|nr:diacylglycerol kinase family protein [Gemmatimonadales bacterium]